MPLKEIALDETSDQRALNRHTHAARLYVCICVGIYVFRKLFLRSNDHDRQTWYAVANRFILLIVDNVWAVE